MGNEVPRAQRPLSTTTSVRGEIELFIAARRKGLNLSAILNSALRSVLKMGEEDMTDEQVSKLLREREARVEVAVVQEHLRGLSAIEDAVAGIRAQWAAYLTAAPKAGRNAKLSWLDGRKITQTALRDFKSSDLLAELEKPTP